MSTKVKLFDVTGNKKVFGSTNIVKNFRKTFIEVVIFYDGSFRLPLEML